MRTREEATFWLDQRSPAKAREQAEEIACLHRQESGTTWEILKQKETVKAVHVCRVKQLPDTFLEPQPTPLTFGRRVRRALGLS